MYSLLCDIPANKTYIINKKKSIKSMRTYETDSTFKNAEAIKIVSVENQPINIEQLLNNKKIFFGKLFSDIGKLRGVYIFGGYVRDLYHCNCNKIIYPKRDIDIMITKNGDWPAFVYVLHKNSHFYTVKIQSMRMYFMIFRHVKHIQLHLHSRIDPNIRLSIDVIYSESEDMLLDRSDLNINTLYMGHEQISHFVKDGVLHSCCRLSKLVNSNFIRTAIECCKNKTFIVTPTCISGLKETELNIRKQKMLDRGWKEITMLTDEWIRRFIQKNSVTSYLAKYCDHGKVTEGKSYIDAITGKYD